MPVASAGVSASATSTGLPFRPCATRADARNTARERGPSAAISTPRGGSAWTGEIAGSGAGPGASGTVRAPRAWPSRQRSPTASQARKRHAVRAPLTCRASAHTRAAAARAPRTPIPPSRRRRTGPAMRPMRPKTGPAIGPGTGRRRRTAAGSVRTSPSSDIASPVRRARCSAGARAIDTREPSASRAAAIAASPSARRSASASPGRNAAPAGSTTWNGDTGNASSDAPHAGPEAARAAGEAEATRTLGSPPKRAASEANASSLRPSGAAIRTTRSPARSPSSASTVPARHAAGASPASTVTTWRGTGWTRPGPAPRNPGSAISPASFAPCSAWSRALSDRPSAKRPWCQAKAPRSGASSPPRICTR